VVEGKDSFGLLRKLKSDNCLPGIAPLDRVPFLLGNGHGSGFMTIAKPLLYASFFQENSREDEAQSGSQGDGGRKPPQAGAS